MLFLPNLPFPLEFPRLLPFLLPLIALADLGQRGRRCYCSLFRDVCNVLHKAEAPTCRHVVQWIIVIVGRQKERTHDATGLFSLTIIVMDVIQNRVEYCHTQSLEFDLTCTKDIRVQARMSSITGVWTEDRHITYRTRTRFAWNLVKTSPIEFESEWFGDIIFPDKFQAKRYYCPLKIFI